MGQQLLHRHRGVGQTTLIESIYIDLGKTVTGSGNGYDCVLESVCNRTVLRPSVIPAVFEKHAMFPLITHSDILTSQDCVESIYSPRGFLTTQPSQKGAI